MQDNIETINAKYTFSDEEKVNMAVEMTEKIQEKDRSEEELKSLKSNFKSRIDELTAKLNRLAQNHRDGYEYRFQKCTLKLNEKTKMREYYTVDTKKLVKTEPWRDTDYQRKLKIKEVKK